MLDSQKNLLLLQANPKFAKNLSYPQATVNGTLLRNVYKGEMKVAFTNGVLGLISSFGVGLFLLEMNTADITLCIAASLFAALIAIFATLKAVKIFPSALSANIRLVRAWGILLLF